MTTQLIPAPRDYAGPGCGGAGPRTAGLCPWSWPGGRGETPPQSTPGLGVHQPQLALSRDGARPGEHGCQKTSLLQSSSHHSVRLSLPERWRPVKSVDSTSLMEFTQWMNLENTPGLAPSATSWISTGVLGSHFPHLFARSLIFLILHF